MARPTLDKSQWKHPPCPYCDSRRQSNGPGKALICSKCGKSSTRETLIDAIPDKHHIKGVSTLVDENGKTKIQWIKTNKESETKEELLKRLIKEIPELVPTREAVSFKPVGQSSDDVLSVYPIGDAHLGMLSWEDETGENFDLKIAKKRITTAVSYLVNQGSPTKKALIISLGDFFHSDNQAGITVRSGNVLDTDSRWAKIIRVGLATMINLIEIALGKHDQVDVIAEIGNHDDHASIMLSIALDAYYHNESRVTIDTSPAKFHYHKFGKNFIGITHGDKVKMTDLNQIMSVDRPKDWGESEYRYWYTGHIHHSKKLELRGCVAESFRTLAAKDAWHVEKGYRSGKDMTKIMLHRDYGEIYRTTCDINLISHLKGE